jgi:hypothetical protein
MYASVLINEFKFVISWTHLFTIHTSVKVREGNCVRLKKAADHWSKQEIKDYIKFLLHSNRTGADEFGFHTLIHLDSTQPVM